MASKVFVFLITFLATIQGSAQTQDEIPLTEVLDSLEQKFNVRFSYADDNIKDVKIERFVSCDNLEACLNQLADKTNLEFKILSDRFIAVSPKVITATVGLCGIITDGESGEVLQNATVSIKNRFTLTDSLGKFSLDIYKTSDTIAIQYIGYIPKFIPVEMLVTEGCPKISLTPNVTLLNAVTIKNFMVRGIDKRFDGSLKVDIPETGILPGLTEPDVLFTIQKLPGIQSIDETVSDINVRGGTNDQNLILWDGIKMYQTGHFFGLISAFNPYLTKEVTLIKNGSSARYFEGVSSVIDIQTFDKVNKNLEAGAGLNMLNGDIFLKLPIKDKIALHLSSRRSLADIVNSPTFNNYFDRAFRDSEVAQFVGRTETLSTNENFFFYDYSGKLLYDISDRDNLRLSFLKVFNQVDYKETGLVNNVVESKNSELQQFNIAGSAKYHRVWSERASTSLSFDLSSYNLTSTNFDIFNDQKLFQENEVLDISLKTNLSLKVSDRWKLNTGYQFNEIGITNIDELNNPEFKRSIKEVLRVHGQFTEMSYTSSSGNTLGRFGVRTNYFEKFDKWRFEPRFAINQLIFDNISLELLGEMKSQVTTQIIDFQTDFLGVEKRRWVLVNDDDIPIITSKQLSLGAHYKRQNLIISLEGFLKRVEGIITSSQGFQNQFEFVRTDGNYTSKGIDVLVNQQFEKINLWSNYSFSRNLYEFKSLTPSKFFNNIDIRHSISLGTSFQHEGLEVSAGINYHTGRPVTTPEADMPIIDGDINFQLPNSSRVEDYIRPDFSVKYSFGLGKKAKAQIGGSLWNFIDHENIINRYYTINDNESIQKVDERALSLTPNVMLRFIY